MKVALSNASFDRESRLNKTDTVALMIWQNKKRNNFISLKKKMMILSFGVFYINKNAMYAHVCTRAIQAMMRPAKVN
jgi:hypothetical protein